MSKKKHSHVSAEREKSKVLVTHFSFCIFLCPPLYKYNTNKKKAKGGKKCVISFKTGFFFAKN